MAWIVNVPKIAVETGQYDSRIPNVSQSILIRILDPSAQFSSPVGEFKEVHKFRFFDTNLDSDPDGISEADADEIASILTEALQSNTNVVVHCTAGRCRSGAIVEVGTIMGFEDLELYRQPNIVVKSRLLKSLGLSY